MIPAQTKAALFQALRFVNRRKWLALSLSVTTFAAVASVVLFLPDVYKATATLLVESQQIPEDYVRSTVTTGVDRRLQEITQALMSRSRMNDLIDRFGLYPELRGQVPNDEIVTRMRRDVRVEMRGAAQRGKGQLVSFTVSYIGRDPRKAAAVANELASIYVEEDLRVRERQAAGTSEFLRHQLEEMKRKLDEQERQVKDFKEQFMGELPQQEGANLSTLERLNGQLLSNQEKQIRTREERAVVQKQLAESGLAATDAPESLAARLAQLQAELYQLRQRYTDRYPDVVQLKLEIAELEKRLADVESGAAEPPPAPPAPPAVASGGAISAGTRLAADLRRLDLELRALQREEARLHERIADYQARVENTPRRAQQFVALQRDYDTTRKLYEGMLRRFEEAKLAESLENRQKGEQFRILDPAIVQWKPNAPNRPVLLFAGFVLSIVVALAAVLGTELFDTSFHDVDELRSFSQAPVLATIQKIPSNEDLRAERWRFRFGVAAASAAILVIVAGSWIVAHDNLWLSSLLS